MDTLQDIERALLVRPFDAELRLRYANELASADRHEDALAQFELLAGQSRESAAPHLGAAAALLALGQEDQATERYQRARTLQGFTAHGGLERLVTEKRRGEPVRLSVIHGGVDNVIPIERAYQDKIFFKDIAGLEDLKRTVRLQIIEPFLRPGLFAKFKKRAGGGVLLYGPPGCGKTMMARAVAS